MTYPCQGAVQEGTVAVYAVVRGQGEYITVTDGMREIVVIVEDARLPFVRDAISTAPAGPPRSGQHQCVAQTAGSS